MPRHNLVNWLFFYCCVRFVLSFFFPCVLARQQAKEVPAGRRSPAVDGSDIVAESTMPTAPAAVPAFIMGVAGQGGGSGAGRRTERTRRGARYVGGCGRHIQQYTLVNSLVCVSGWIFFLSLDVKQFLSGLTRARRGWCTRYHFSLSRRKYRAFVVALLVC